MREFKDELEDVSFELASAGSMWASARVAGRGR